MKKIQSPTDTDSEYDISSDYLTSSEEFNIRSKLKETFVINYEDLKCSSCDNINQHLYYVLIGSILIIIFFIIFLFRFI